MSRITVVSPAESKDSQVHTAYFRGRKLMAIPHEVPANYTGYVLREGHVQAVDLDDEDAPTRALRTTESFNTITVWGHNSVPDHEKDPWICGTSDWLSVAHLIHDPIVPTQAESSADYGSADTNGTNGIDSSNGN